MTVKTEPRSEVAKRTVKPTVKPANPRRGSTGGKAKLKASQAAIGKYRARVQNPARDRLPLADELGLQVGAGPAALDFGACYEADPMERILLTKQGVPATTPGAIATRLGLTKERLYAVLGLPRATVERKVRENKLLSPEESARVIGIGRLVGQVQKMVAESGQPAGFDAGRWLAGWLETPVPALGGRLPSELMDTAEGQALVSNILSRVQTGAYS